MDAEHLAAAQWTRLAEPGDAIASAIIEAMGYAEGLELVRAAACSSGASSGIAELDVLQSSSAAPTIARWAHRLSMLDPFIPDYLYRQRIAILTRHDPEWPEHISDLSDPPIALWVRGDVDAVRHRAVAIVGSRTCTAYGAKAARDMAHDLSDSFTIVSGGAFGIDAHAHSGALLAAGTTVIVSAGGVDRAYPRAHDDLFDQVAQSGAVISESPLGAAPQRHRFLTRNRLIAALAGATVVVEAPLRSGALSTARHALAMGRPVGGIPGPIDAPMSEGVHDLLRNGGTLVRGADDVRELASWQQLTLADAAAGDFFTPAPDDRHPIEERVWEAVPLRRAASTASIASVAGLTIGETQAKLGALALAKRVERTDRGWRRVVG